MRLKSLFKIEHRDCNIDRPKYFNSLIIAHFFMRSGDRIKFDPRIKKYYLKRIEEPFW